MASGWTSERVQYRRMGNVSKSAGVNATHYFTTHTTHDMRRGAPPWQPPPSCHAGTRRGQPSVPRGRTHRQRQLQHHKPPNPIPTPPPPPPPLRHSPTDASILVASVAPMSSGAMWVTVPVRASRPTTPPPPPPPPPSSTTILTRPKSDNCAPGRDGKGRARLQEREVATSSRQAAHLG